MILCLKLPTTQSTTQRELRAGKPKLICLAKWGSPRGVYRTRPGDCDLHTRDTPAFHPTVTVAKRLRWTRWAGWVAVAKGKLGIGTYDLAALKLLLSGLREAVGCNVYTKAEFVVTIYYDGKKHRGGRLHPIDDCLPGGSCCEGR